MQVAKEKAIVEIHNWAGFKPDLYLENGRLGGILDNFVKAERERINRVVGDLFDDDREAIWAAIEGDKCK